MSIIGLWLNLILFLKIYLNHLILGLCFVFFCTMIKKFPCFKEKKGGRSSCHPWCICQTFTWERRETLPSELWELVFCFVTDKWMWAQHWKAYQKTISVFFISAKNYLIFVFFFNFFSNFHSIAFVADFSVQFFSIFCLFSFN